jgi:fumarylacetoacetate (FAA) hydrolase
MKLATLRDGTRDGHLVVISPSGDRYRPADGIAKTLQAALDDWTQCEPKLRAIAQGFGPNDGNPLDPSSLMAPLPRAYEWLDGSAFLNHVELVRRSRGAEVPGFLRTDPLMYQGGSGCFQGAREPFVLKDVAWGLDLESEVAVVLGDVAQGCTAVDAASAVRLLVLVNDWSYRNLIPDELAKGFGFVISKPTTGFSPFAVTPDELGDAFREGRVHLPLRSELNGELLGDPHAGHEMFFSFFDLIAHVARTRSLCAGTVLGSGTVSNRDPSRGVSCLAELRMRETIEHGAPSTRFLVPGDVVRIEMFDERGRSVFGCIEQLVTAPGEQS